MELLPSLLAGLKAVCAAFPDPRKGRGGNIAMADFGLSAFAMFFMQSASFLSFQRALEKGQGRSNCQTLFGIGKIPSDNYIRDMLDAADPALLAPCFERLETLLAEPPLHQAFGRLGGRTLVAWDGTEFFCSQKLGCPHCLTRQRSNGKLESHHSMLSATVVAQGHAKVVPLMPEFIAPQDGAEKQDCERNAVKRWFGKHHARLAPLRPIYLGDDLFACEPVAKMVCDAGGDFIFTCKPGSHAALYDFIDGAEPFRHTEKVANRKTKNTHRYRWFEAVPLRDGKDAMLVNWIGFEILDAKGRVKYSMAWVTSLAVIKQNVAEIAACEQVQRGQDHRQKRLRARTQFRPRRDVSGDDPGRAEPARLRLARGARHSGAALEGRARGGDEANQLLRPSGDPDRLRGFPVMAGLPRIPRDFHHPAGTSEGPEKRMKNFVVTTFRIADAARLSLLAHRRSCSTSASGR